MPSCTNGMRPARRGEVSNSILGGGTVAAVQFSACDGSSQPTFLVGGAASPSRRDLLVQADDFVRGQSNSRDLSVSSSTKQLVLWIDDHADDLVVRVLALEGFRLQCAASGAAGLEMAHAQRYDAYIVDLCLPDIYGLSVLERLIHREQCGPIVIMTGMYVEPESEALARRLGAADVWFKPMAGDEMAEGLRRLIREESSSRFLIPGLPDASQTRSAAPGCVTRYGIIAASRPMQDVLDWINRVGPTEMPVLLTGETGTGKELVARGLHARSPRAKRAFVAVNCGSIPEGLRETELFGHCKGAFTGAVRDKRGLIEEADAGTLFLDEVADLAPPLQVQLLRALDSGEIRRIGNTQNRRVDVRVIAATNRSLADEVHRGSFREDLYYRLAGAIRHLPPLRERLEDIDALITFWLPSIVGQQAHRVRGITAEGLKLLRGHTWRGNARELRHVLESAVCLATSDQLTEREVLAALAGRPLAGTRTSREPHESYETQRTLSVLERTQWNRTLSARILGIDRKTLWRRLQRWGIGSAGGAH